MTRYRVDKLAWLGLALAVSAYTLVMASYRYLHRWAGWPAFFWVLIGAVTVGFGVCLVAVARGLPLLKTTDQQQRLHAWTAILVGTTVVLIYGLHVYLAWRMSKGGGY